MAITVVQNLTPITEADSTTGWVASQGTTAADTGVYREATASIATEIRTAGMQYLMFTSTTTWNLSSTHIYAWLNYLFAADLQNRATGGIRIRVSTTSSVNTNYGEWYVGGSDTYGGSWRCFAQDTSAGFNATSGTPPTLSSIVGVGFSFNILNTGKAVESTFVDAIRYGDGVTVYADDTATYTMQNIYDAVEANTNGAAAGIIRKEGGVYLVQGKLRFGDASGTNSFYFSDTNQILVFEDANVSASHYEILVQGNSTGNTRFQLGSVTGSGTSMVGSEGFVIKSANTSLPFAFNATDNDIQQFKMYGSTLVNAGTVNLGSTSTALGKSGSTIHLVDNNFTNPTQVVRNISSSASENYSVRNNIVSANSSRASLNIYDGVTTTSGQWTITEGKGFEDSATAATVTVSGEPFPNTTANKPYVSVLDSASAIWNLNDVSDSAGGRISVTDQTEIAFDGNSNGQVNEQYTVTWKTQTPEGTAVSTSRVKIVASDNGSGSPALENEGSSNGTGDATTTYLRARFVPSGASSLTTTTHVPAAFKSYKYGKLPFYTSATINQPVSVTATHTPDLYQVETTAATAVSAGESGTAVSILEASTNEHSLIKFVNGAGGTLSNDDTITASGASPATGQVVGKIIEGDSAAGTILLDNRNGSTYDNGETLSNGSGWTANYTNSSEQRFHWIVDAGLSQSRSAQTLYDYIMAKLDEATADTSPTIDKLIIDGRAEFGTPYQGVSTSPNKFKTVRNVSLTRGWAIANLNNLSLITQFTDNAGTAFTPAATVNLTVTIKNQAGTNLAGVEVAIFQDNAARTVVLASTPTDEDGQVTTTVVSGLGAIIIRARQSTEIATFLTSQAFTSELVTTVESNHNFQTGDPVVYSKDGGSATIGLTEGTTYYVREDTANTLYLYDTAAHAVAGGGTGLKDLTTNGAETHQLNPVRYVAGSATGTVGSTDFSSQITLVTDNIATG
ncbi:MAG TPA: hypothetical protein VI819_02450 [Patescibacteria group bacterium]|nr:hypothetical protein [Patescibacteria group bacterium]